MFWRERRHVPPSISRPQKRNASGLTLVILTGGLDLSVGVARLNSAEGNIGETLALPAIAAVLIGDVAVRWRGDPIWHLRRCAHPDPVFNGMNWRPPVTGVIIALTVRLGMYGRKERRARRSKARSKKGARQNQNCCARFVSIDPRLPGRNS